MMPVVAPVLPKLDCRVVVTVPAYRGLSPKTAVCLLALQQRYGSAIALDPYSLANVWHARNALATRFLKSTAEWSFHIDDDMIFPCGNVELAYRYGYKGDQKWMQQDAIERLTSHGKQLVSGLYFGRNPKGIAQFWECFENAGDNPDNFAAHKNVPRDELHETDSFGFGCCIVHRSVYEAIIQTQPDVLPPGYPDSNEAIAFFTPNGMRNYGEDSAFCVRAAKAGIKSYVDFGCVAGHCGEMVYWHSNTEGA